MTHLARRLYTTIITTVRGIETYETKSTSGPLLVIRIAKSRKVQIVYFTPCTMSHTQLA